MKFIGRLLIFCSLIFGFTVSGHGAMPTIEWQTGQVIAISEMAFDPTTFLIEAATGSRFGHIGIVVVKDGKPVVVHADPTKRGIGVDSVERFLARSHDSTCKLNYVVLAPTNGLSASQALKLERAISTLQKRKPNYNFKQVYRPESNDLNCSEFVYTVFKASGLGEIGEVELIHSALNMNAMSGGLRTLAELFGADLNFGASDRVVTPLSIVKSSKLRLIEATLPTARRLSDAEIFEIWSSGGGLAFLPPDLLKPFEIEGVLAKSPSSEFPRNWRLD